MPVHANSDDPSASPVLGSRARQAVLGIGLLAPPAVIGFVSPALGTVVGAVELTVVLVVLLTAVYGSERTSDRAFRVICLALNRAEPAAARASN
ncbi:hypothetical protein [Streptomyces neyagawaensis]|uniref:hypothetical protein n=1 Tax=Streptomyces neyagawaensis TaxID=42238 RepID=UPI0006E20371|nr:hypothetical protein [Streptomyces neyagawaensis]MCL6737420.1 hypothetical protein [Streptomyces neyagawaensis]